MGSEKMVEKKPKNVAPWEKTALEAGWTPPAKRAKELVS